MHGIGPRCRRPGRAHEEGPEDQERKEEEEERLPFSKQRFVTRRVGGVDREFKPGGEAHRDVGAFRERTKIPAVVAPCSTHAAILDMQEQMLTAHGYLNRPVVEN